jgi:hypothetical protein
MPVAYSLYMFYRALFSLFLLALPAAGASGDDLVLNPTDIAQETAWLESLGVKGTPVIEHPFSFPLSHRSFILPLSWYRSIGDQRPEFRRGEISADLLGADLPLLRIVMEKAYGGWDQAAKRGWNWSQWFDGWAKLLADKKGQFLPIRTALAPYADLMNFQLDNHSGPLEVARFQSGSRSAVLSAPPTGACTEMKAGQDKIFSINAGDAGQQPRRAMLSDMSTAVWYLSYPDQRGDVVSVHCGDKWIEAKPAFQAQDSDRARNVLAIAHTSEDVPSFRPVSDSISYLRLPTFTKQNGERLRALLSGLPKSAGSEKLLIVDLRGNGGGDAPLEEMSRWLDAGTVKTAQNPNRRLAQSCLYSALKWGYTEVSIAGTQPPISELLRGRLQQEVDGLMQPSPEGCPAAFEERKSEWNYSRHKLPARPRFLVLVDNRCASDCELMAYAFAAASGTVIAGVNTYGMAQYIQPGYFLLPHSRLPFRIALGTSDIYGDGRSVDGYGLDVDVLLPGELDETTERITRLAELLSSQPRQ